MSDRAVEAEMNKTILESLRSGENSSLDTHELGHLIYHSQMAELQFVGRRGTPTSPRLALSAC